MTASENQEMQNRASETVPIDDDFLRARIFTVRGVQVMFDHDLAVLYGVEKRVLNQVVKRSAERFPSDLMFQVEAVAVADAVAIVLVA